MKPTEKQRVAVLYGGRSAEHEVSLRSAANVMSHLDKTLFDVVPVGIDKQGRWFLGDDVFKKSLEQNQVPALSHEWFSPECIREPIQHTPMTTGHAFDVVFPAVHGTFCEDGTLQGLLELADLPYVGCGVLSSALNMDKDVSKRLAQVAGINIVPFIVIKEEQWHAEKIIIQKNILDTLSYPVFVKPANTGSSIGVNKVKSPDALEAAILEAFKFDNKILIEKALNVRELEVAVLQSLEPNGSPIISTVGEIKPTHEFYSYDAKYTDDNGAELCIPAPVSEDIANEAKRVAGILFQALECEGMARVDLFLDKDTQQIYFNEINTLPGFTKISMYPKLMDASGIAYTELLTHLIKLAVKRYDQKKKLSRSYTD